MKDINQIKQNKPSLIAMDYSKQYGIDVNDSYEILLNRGVFKWFAVRRDLIKLKNKWKERLKNIYGTMHHFKNDPYSLGYHRGYKRALELCRKEVRALCHSERLRVQDNDKAAKRWLNEQN